jgi:hypothetical protein
MDTCTDCQIELEKKQHRAIDELPEAVARHVETCSACQAYQQELAEMQRVMQLTLAPTVAEIQWQRIARRARWVAHRPYRELAYTLTLIALTFVWGFVHPSTWLVTGGLLLYVLPDRISSWKKRRKELQRLCERSSELFAAVAKELKWLEGKCVLNALFYAALGILFVVVAPFLNDLRPPLAVAAILFVMAWYNMIVRRRRAIRMQSELAQ